jgi:predicted alpha-1,6-mannanase (GH76 family)
VATLLIGIITAACTAQSNGETSAQFAQWGAETLDTIKRDLWLADRGLYAEKSESDGDRPTVPAFMWGAGVQLTALAAAAQTDPATYVPQLAAYADALEKHWIVHNGIGGYSVLPEQKRADRYYDDNVWIVLALVETLEAAHDQKYLERAQATMRFVLSGEDEELGGGIYWRENRRNSKNTCSNAPAIVAALRLHQKTSDPQHLAAAERLYDWTRSHLQDEADGLYWDNMRLSGRLDRRKYSYNSALMIRANCLLFEVKKGPKYLAEAQRIARSAVARWIVPETGGVKDGGQFAHLLLESLLAVGRVDRDPQWLETVKRSVNFVHENLRDSNGRYAHRWDRPQSRARESFQLIDQASAARAFFVTARAVRESGQSSVSDQ